MILERRGKRKESHAVILVAMLGIDRRALQTAWTWFVFAIVLLAVYEIRHTLVLFALALFLAHLLGPVVERVHFLIPPSGSRGPAIALVYLVLLGALVGVAIPIGSKIVEQAAGLATKLPGLTQSDPLAHLRLPGWLESQRENIDAAIRDRLQKFGEELVPMLSAAGEHVLSGLGSMLSLILIPILSFFALKDGQAIRRALLGAVGPGERELLDGILTDLHQLLARYMRALLMLAIATFISHTIFLSAMGVPYATLLAGVAASLEVIPAVGPLMGAAIIMLVAAFSGYPHLLWLVFFFACYRLFQDYILSPFLMSEGVEVHPLLVLLGVLAGAEIAGVPGMFFSVPVIAALKVIITRVRDHSRDAI